jgi:hypothetical protein
VRRRVPTPAELRLDFQQKGLIMISDENRRLLKDRDIRMYELVPSQTSPGDRRSLLELQRMVREKHGTYVYLEIGSFLGGTLTPFCIDEACRAIYSVDARVVTAPNEGSCLTSDYGSHTSLAMRQRLAAATGFDSSKLLCLDSDMRNVAEDALPQKPHLVFIDGEHTNTAVFSDFVAVEKFLAADAVIAFHDYWCVEGGVQRCLEHLRERGNRFSAVKLEGEVFAVFLDGRMPLKSDYVRGFLRRWRWIAFRRAVKSLTPNFLVQAYRRFIKRPKTITTRRIAD